MPKATWGDIEGNPFEDDLEDYDVYEGDLPPKGVYRCTLKFLRLKENSNGDPMLNGLLVINEPKGSKKAQYNGYDFWFNQNVTKQGAPYLNNFLSALVPEDKVAALRKAFWGQKVMLDKNEPPNVVSIGTLKLLDKTPLLMVNTKKKQYNGEDSLDVSKFMRVKDDDAADDADEAGDEEEWSEEEGEEPEGDDAPAELSEEDEEIAEREEELAEMSLAALKKIARTDLGMKLAEVKNLDEEALIDAIIEREFPEDEEEEEEPDEEEEEEPEEEPEPEPAPKRTRARRTAAPKAEPAPAATKRRPAAKGAEEAPTRARTGTRRRKAAAGDPPF